MATYNIITLGEISVEVGHGPGSISGTHAWNNPKQELVTRKPTKQRTGETLDKLNLTLRLRKEFLTENGITDNPKQVYKKIKKLGDDAEVFVVTEGTGDIYGKYTLESLAFSVTDTADNGGWVDVELTIELEEYADAKSKQSAKALWD